MKTFYYTLIAMLLSYSAIWAQTSYGGLEAAGTTAGINGDDTNSYFGHQAGSINTGVSNTFTGYQSGQVNIGNGNTFMGNRSGWKNTTGETNTFIGSISGAFNDVGERNTFLGYGSGYKNTSGSRNTFVGFYSGLNTTEAIYNTFIGYYSGGSNTTGSSNTFLGYNSGFTNTVGGGNVFLGYKAGYSETGSSKLYIDNSDTGAPLIWGDFATDVVNFNANVGIGTTTPDAKLAVKGDIHAQEVRVDLNGAVAPDYVFEPDYTLRTLTETEAYIKANKHLPEIPSAAEMEENGVELKVMNLKLLQKVEELTLYTIGQQKLIEAQQKQLQSLQERVNELKRIKNK